MEYPVEYMMGIMIAASAFITIAGILFAVGLNNKLIGKINAALLLASILLGALAIAGVLGWFSNPTDLMKLLVTFGIAIQVMSFYFPLLFLLRSIDKPL